MVQKYVAYYRVSSLKQGTSGLGLEAQQEAVRQHLKGAPLVATYTEVESGKKNDRPKLIEALRMCRLYNATLVIAKIDRLARNVSFISAIMDSSIDFIACDFPTANRLTVHILAAVAEHEAAAISTRTKAALAAAKARGTILGGDRSGKIGSLHQVGMSASLIVRQGKALDKAKDLVPVIHTLQAEGHTSLRAVAAVLNERGITTAKGGEWSAVQIQRVLAKIA